MSAIAPTAAPAPPRSHGIYRRLQRRNGVIARLRILVPVVGLFVLGLLGVQMAIISLTREFHIGRITIERNTLSVETPSYAGLLADGSSYDITAGTAETALDRPATIKLKDLNVLLKRATGVEVTLTATDADVETQRQVVDIAGTAQIADSTGMTATVNDIHADLLAQVVTADGHVALTYTGGATIDAASMMFDAPSNTWRFNRATVVLPDIPSRELELK